MELISRLGPYLVPIVAIIVGGAIAIAAMLMKHRSASPRSSAELIPTRRKGRDDAVIGRSVSQLDVGRQFDWRRTLGGKKLSAISFQLSVKSKTA